MKLLPKSFNSFIPERLRASSIACLMFCASFAVHSLPAVSQPSPGNQSYQEHTRQQTKQALKEMLKEKGLEQMLTELEGRKIVFLKDLTLVSTRVNRKDVWFHMSYNAFRTAADFKTQFDPLTRDLLLKTCEDPEFEFLIDQGVRFTYTFEGPDQLALGGFDVTRRTCKKLGL